MLKIHYLHSVEKWMDNIGSRLMKKYNLFFYLKQFRLLIFQTAWSIQDVSQTLSSLSIKRACVVASREKWKKVELRSSLIFLWNWIVYFLKEVIYIVRHSVKCSCENYIDTAWKSYGKEPYSTKHDSQNPKYHKYSATTAWSLSQLY